MGVRDIGPFSPTTVVEDGAGESWTDPDNIKASDDARAVHSSTGQVPTLLKCTGFNAHIHPPQSTYGGITVTVEGHKTGEGRTIRVSLYPDGTIDVANRKTSGAMNDSSDSVLTLGGDAETWGLTMNHNMLSEAAGFGIGVTALYTGEGGAAVAKIDHATFKLRITEPDKQWLPGAMQTYATAEKYFGGMRR